MINSPEHKVHYTHQMSRETSTWLLAVSQHIKASLDHHHRRRARSTNKTTNQFLWIGSCAHTIRFWTADSPFISMRLIIWDILIPCIHYKCYESMVRSSPSVLGRPQWVACWGRPSNHPWNYLVANYPRIVVVGPTTRVILMGFLWGWGSSTQKTGVNVNYPTKTIRGMNHHQVQTKKSESGWRRFSPFHTSDKQIITNRGGFWTPRLRAKEAKWGVPESWPGYPQSSSISNDGIFHEINHPCRGTSILGNPQLVVH